MLAKALCFIFIFMSILQFNALLYFWYTVTGNLLNALRGNSTDNYIYINGTLVDYNDGLDCFINVTHGAYKVCTATQKVSIYSSILLLMVQLLVSRIIFPGVSNFLNASVWTPPLHAHGSAACHAPDDSPFDGCL